MKDNSGRILLIEDNRETQLLIKVLLRNYYSLDISGEYENSIKLLDKNNYMLVLLDINLSGSKDGIKILQHIKQLHNSDISVIIISAYDFTEEEKKYLVQNSNDFITKPFEKELLLNSIKKILQRDKVIPPVHDQHI